MKKSVDSGFGNLFKSVIVFIVYVNAKRLLNIDYSLKKVIWLLKNNFDTGFGYVVYGDMYTIKCCGMLKKWEFSVGDNGNIDLQIWRPDDKRNKQFKLVGFNRYSVSRKFEI